MSKSEDKSINSKPWYINMVIWLFDSAATVVLLGFAILGAIKVLDTNLASSIRLGIAVFIVGFLAARLLERLFAKR